MMGLDIIRQLVLQSLPAAMLVLSVSAALADPQYITIDGVRLVSINKHGTVAGYDSYTQDYGLVVTRHGRKTYFSVTGSIATRPAGINDKGVIAGTYQSGYPEFLYHGFLRAPDGTITTFDAAKIYRSDSQGTFVTGIDNRGYITGYVQKSRRHEYGFIRNPQGKITKVECGSTRTTTLGINSDRTTIGICGDGYLRAPDGTFTTLTGLDPAALNDAGAVTGDLHGSTLAFLRTPDGTVSTFDPSDGNRFGTMAMAINSANVVVGYYDDAQDHNHGFIRTPDGTITSLDLPGSTGTFPATINESGVIAGTYFAGNGTVDGFIRLP